MEKTCSFFLFFFFLTFSVFAQGIEVRGAVVDELGFPLEGATLIFTNESKTEKKYTITNEAGEFKIDLNKELRFLKVSFMGYQPAELILNAVSEFIEIKLNPSDELLEEVVLDIKPESFLVTKDTVSIDVGQFLTGDEFKMIDALRKIPGIAVEGKKILVQGKEIKKVLVEGDLFFKGNTSFAVENIPADVIKTIQVIDDYNEVSFLSPLTRSEEAVINVKLKKDRKTFDFGELSIGYGNDNFYAGQGNYVKYNPRTQLAVVGAVNNVSGSLDNVLDLVDDASLENRFRMNRFFNVSGFDNKEHKSNVQNGLGASLKHKFGEKSKMNITSLFKNYLTEDEKLSTKQFLDPENPYYTQSSLSSEKNGNDFLLDVNYSYEERDKERFSFNSVFNFSESSTDLFFQSQQPTSFLNIQELRNFQEWLWHSELSYSKKFSEKYTTHFTLNHQSKNGDTKTELSSDEILFPEHFPWFALHEISDTKRHMTDLKGELYYSLSKKFVFDFKLNTNWEAVNLKTETSSPSDVSGFLDADKILLLHHHVSVGLAISEKSFFIYPSFKSGYVNTGETRRGYAAPSLKLSYKKSLEKEIVFKYDYAVKPADPFYLNNLLLLRDYTTLLSGNPFIEPEEYHLFDLNIFLSDFSTGMTFYAKAYYKHYKKSLITVSTLIGERHESTFQTTDAYREEVNAQVVLGKVFSKFKVNVSPLIRFSKLPQVVENTTFHSENTNFRVRINAETMFQDFPNVFIGFTQSQVINKTEFFENKYGLSQIIFRFFQNKGPLEYNLNYIFSKSSNPFLDETQQLRFNLQYQFKKSQWSAFIRGENLLDDAYASNRFMSDVAITEELVSRIPRHVLLGISYKF